MDARITVLYEKLFNREPEAAGLAYWENAVASGATDLNGLTYAIVFGAQNSDSTIIRNKVAVADAFTTLVSAGAGQYDGAAATAVARTMISSVTDQASSVTAASNELGAYLNAATVATASPSLFTPVIGTQAVIIDPNVISTTLTADNFTAVAGKAYFSVTDAAGVVTFNTNAAGEISVSVSGGTATFTEQGVAGSVTVTGIAAKTISLAAGQVLDINADAASGLRGVAISGLGTVQASQLTIAEMNGLHFAGWSGTLTYSLADGAANLLADHTFVAGAVGVTVTDAASLADLATLSGSTSGTVTATTIVDTDANLIADAGLYVKGATNVTITDTTNVADLSILVAETTGTVSYASIADTDANLLAAHTFVAGAVNVSVTDAASLADLATLAGEITGSLTYAGVADTDANLLADTTYVHGAPNVIVTDAVDLAALATLSGLTTGTVTATTIVDTDANLIADAGLYVKGATNVTITDTTDVADLSVLFAETTGTVSYASIADTDAHLMANGDAYGKGDLNVTVTDAASLADLATLKGNLTGAGTLTYSAVADTDANLLADHTYVSGGVSVLVTDSASLADLAALSAETTGKVSYGTIADSAANLLADTTYVNGSVNLNVTGTVNVADLNTLEAKTTGSIAYHLADTAADIAAAIGTGASPFASATDILQTNIELSSATGTAGVADTFKMAAAGTTTITNFEHGVDHIDLSSFITTANVVFGAVAADGHVDVQISTSGSDCIVTIDSNTANDGVVDTTIKLVGQAAAGINATDFIFHA